MTAAEVVARSTGHRKVAIVIRELMEKPVKVGVHKKASITATSRELSCVDALDYYVDCNSTTYLYSKNRKFSTKTGHHVFQYITE